MFKSLLLFFMGSLIVSGAYAEIFKWTDSQGTVHFSDTPQRGAVKVDLPETQSFSAPAPAKTQESSRPIMQNKQREHIYSKISIEQPQNEATIRNNQGSVLVSVQVDPELMAGDRVKLLLDGTPMGEPQAALQFNLSGIFRGSHTLVVQIIGENGDILNTSESITFFMFRPTVGRANNVAK